MADIFFIDAPAILGRKVKYENDDGEEVEGWVLACYLDSDHDPVFMVEAIGQPGDPRKIETVLVVNAHVTKEHRNAAQLLNNVLQDD